MLQLIQDFKKGKIENAELIDIAPTIIEIVGVEESYQPMDGRSLLPCVEGKDQERMAFSESHTNGVYEPCFMVRKDQYKYIYIRNEQHQLFNLEKDPGEWLNLCGNPEYAEIVKELRSAVLEHFDPDAVEEELMLSLRNRAIIKQANETNDLHWDYSPFFDATKQFAR